MPKMNNFLSENKVSSCLTRIFKGPLLNLLADTSCEHVPGQSPNSAHSTQTMAMSHGDV